MATTIRNIISNTGIHRVGAYFAKASAVSGLALILGAVALPSFAAEPVGTSVRIKNEVRASQGNRRLAPKDTVFEQERITAALSSHGELRLNDNSKVIVGENSVVSLDDFVVGSRGFESGTFNVAKGAFRLVTGNSKKNSMKVKTPLATIGARGTVFDVYVGPGGVTRVVLFSGSVEVCSSANCIVTDNRCDIVQVTPGNAEELPYLRSGNVASENAEYDLISRQARFQSGWRAPTAACSVRAALDPGLRKIRKPVPERTGDNNLGLGRSDSGGEYETTPGGFYDDGYTY